MAKRGVADDGPKHDEQDVCTETHPFHHCPRDQSWSNDGKGHLEHCKENGWNRQTIFDAFHTAKAKMLKGTKPRAPFAKRNRIAKGHPTQRADAHGDHAHHHGVQNTLTTNQAAVEKGEAWCHQQHQSRRGQNPSRVRCRNCVHEGMMETGPTIFNTPLDSLRQTFTALIDTRQVVAQKNHFSPINRQGI